MSEGTNLCNSIGLQLAAIKFKNGLLSSNSATLKQALYTDLKLVPRATTSWASDILRDCEAVTHMHKFSCRGSLFVTQIFTADLRFRMMKVCWDIAEMNSLETTTN